VEARIIGLKGAGKRTLLAALSDGRVDGAAIATVRVGDVRVRRLSEMFKPKKTTFAEFKVRMADWPAATGRRSEMERYLISLAGAHVFLHVLRGFNNPMLGEAPDPARDLAALDQEFLVGDLIAIERAFERAKKAKLSDLGRHALERAKEALEAETPVRLIDFPDDELAFITPYNLLTQVPQVLLLNLESGSSAEEAAGAAESLGAAAAGRMVLAFPFSDAAEVATLSPEEQEEFAAALGLPGPAADLVTGACFAQLGLISFLTAGEDEVRAWPIRAGLNAKKAAGAIHSDIERGFIRAEVVAYDTFLEHGSFKACRDAGVLRLEGKDYVVQDGDIVEFRFNV
jgi:hypothetical protein